MVEGPISSPILNWLVSPDPKDPSRWLPYPLAWRRCLSNSSGSPRILVGTMGAWLVKASGEVGSMGRATTRRTQDPHCRNTAATCSDPIPNNGGKMIS